MAMTTPDLNAAAQELQQGFTSIDGFGHMVADAYALPGASYVAPLLIFAILGIAVYVKTQNASVTAATLLLFLGIWGAIFTNTGGARLVQIIVGLLVLGMAYVIVRAVRHNE